MARRVFVVSYDITEDKRRTAVFNILHGYGDHLQYSVFVCDLNDVELSALRTQIRGEINAREDQVLFIDLGPSAGNPEASIEAIGVAYQPMARSMVV